MKNPIETKRYGIHNLNLNFLPTITKLMKNITNPNNPRNNGINEYPKNSINNVIIFCWKKLVTKKYVNPTSINGKTNISVVLDLLIPNRKSKVDLIFPPLSIWKNNIMINSRMNKSIKAKSKLANTINTDIPNSIEILDT